MGSHWHVSPPNNPLFLISHGACEQVSQVCLYDSHPASSHADTRPCCHTRTVSCRQGLNHILFSHPRPVLQARPLLPVHRQTPTCRQNCFLFSFLFPISFLFRSHPHSNPSLALFLSPTHPVSWISTGWDVVTSPVHALEESNLLPGALARVASCRPPNITGKSDHRSGNALKATKPTKPDRGMEGARIDLSSQSPDLLHSDRIHWGHGQS